MKRMTSLFFRRLSGALRQAQGAVAQRLTLFVFLLGLGLFGAGLWLAWPPLGFIGPGAILMAISIFGGGGAGTGSPGAGGGDDISQ